MYLRKRNQFRQTSLQAFKDLRQSGQLNKLQELVYNWFNNYPVSTDKEISELSGLAINIVTARRNELVKLGELVQYNKRNCHVTGRLAITWTPEVNK